MLSLPGGGQQALYEQWHEGQSHAMFRAGSLLREQTSAADFLAIVSMFKRATDF